MAVKVLHIVAVIFSFTACRSQFSPCPSADWQVVGDNTCMLFVNKFRLSYGEANSFCTSRGASLLRFHSMEDVESFADMATGQSTDGWWSDLSDIDQPGTWTWAGDERVVPGALAWATEPTDTHHVENCVAMDIAGYLSDEDCSQRLGYICAHKTNASAEICAGDFDMWRDTCYMVSDLDDSTQLKTWTDAIQACSALSPKPGVIPVLANFTTKDYLNGVQTNVMLTSVPGKWWTSMNDRTTEREWDWADGTRVTDTSFMDDQWKTFPDKGSGDSCGLAHSDGHMEEANCADQHHFACQQTINPDQFFLDTGLGCPSPWMRGGTKCYFMDTARVTNLTATRSFCTAMKGALLRLQNRDEWDWVLRLTVRKRAFNVWTGLQRTAAGVKQWKWDDGSAADATALQWNSQPTNSQVGAGEHCAFINTDGVYSDTSCFAAHAFICEIDSEDQPCPDHWLSDDSQDFTTCYYVSNIKSDGRASWQEAVSKCRELAGKPEAHLVAITSKSEKDYLVSLMMTQPYAAYWIDLTDNANHGVWTFSEDYMGTPLSPIPWDEEPNNWGGNENCVVIYADGKLNDVPCQYQAHVLCERPAAVSAQTGGGGTTQSSSDRPKVSMTWIFITSAALLILCAQF